jgi:hypothetical protein
MSRNRCYTVFMSSKSAMRFKPPLTRDDLAAIQDRSLNSPDTRALLWEIAHLRALVLRTHDYFRQGTPTMAIVMGETLRTILEDEPVIGYPHASLVSASTPCSYQFKCRACRSINLAIGSLDFSRVERILNAFSIQISSFVIDQLS